MSGKKKGPAPNNGVGYGRPPVHSRFRKGHSGNPTGKRRRDEAERTKKLICQEAYRLLTIREGDKVTKMPALQALLRSQITCAAKGNIAAQRAVIKAVQDIEAEARARRTTSSNKKVKDLSDMSDEELLAIVAAEEDGQA